jgi:hypothetical protein
LNTITRKTTWKLADAIGEEGAKAKAQQPAKAQLQSPVKAQLQSPVKAQLQSPVKAQVGGTTEGTAGTKESCNDQDGLAEGATPTEGRSCSLEHAVTQVLLLYSQCAASLKIHCVCDLAQQDLLSLLQMVHRRFLTAPSEVRDISGQFDASRPPRRVQPPSVWDEPPPPAWESLPPDHGYGHSANAPRDCSSISGVALAMDENELA